MNIGELRDRVAILCYTDGKWEQKYSAWAKPEKSLKRCIYAPHTQAKAETVVFTVRYNRNITKHCAILFGGRHYPISSIIDVDGKRQYVEITAVQITPVDCTVSQLNITKNELNNPVSEQKNVFFGKVLFDEKYLGFAQENPQMVVESRFIIVVPKAVSFNEGDIAAVQGASYVVMLCHTQDEYVNEYEVMAQKDV